ncbi:radical SAM protein [Methanonatronarchaeum sp. AMET6-2]|uniref:B12-binding domain-containing radical SAM protein n=1 Tax=Methanonatronarchaeum sp. AMET6-2 TaxID=2933293 RepID=UPI001FF1BC11|nr:radical SAM protein [Methanonatronarchaeum sp. AMET6-2]UOY09822.1 B12-binding domain-containing radical SAM protein [Methanonatronarchaeum sp. AMET6-2]
MSVLRNIIRKYNDGDTSPRVVLTADETMMSNYKGGIFLGFSTCMPTGIFPSWLYFRAIAPPVPRENGRAVHADYGLRMAESILLENGFTKEEVAVVHPKDLKKVVGHNTEIIGITGHDLLGINPPTSEFVEFMQTGPPLNRLKFLELLKKPCVKDKTVIVGGKSAWQVSNPELMNKLGIDHVYIGEAETAFPDTVKNILKGKEVPEIITSDEAEVEEIPELKGGTIHGLVETMRGCGRGCDFCTPAMQKLRFKPIKKILKDINTNIEAGNERVLLHSEDILRYGSRKITPDREKVKRLFREVSQIEGIKEIKTSHISLASVYHNPDLLKQISEICFTLPEQRIIGTQTGIETGSPRIIDKYMKGKPLPSEPEKWPEIVEQALGILNDNKWFPACTLMYGLPAEKEEDVNKTLELLDDIKHTEKIIVPLNFVSMEGSALSEDSSFTAKDMQPVHWQLIGECMDQSINSIEKLLKKEQILNQEGNFIKNSVFRYFIKHLLKNAEKYTDDLKKGKPPKDYKNLDKNYRNPEVTIKN